MVHIRKKLILIGAPKCGTTSLAHWLGRHPKMQIGWAKEPCYFTDYRDREFRGPGTPGFPRKTVYERDAYEAMYDGDPQVEWGIDGSTDYFSSEVAPTALAEYAKAVDVRLVAILRDPVLRAFSQYAHTRDRRLETMSFVEALALEDERRDAGWIPLFHHIRRSRYGANLARFYDAFAEDKLLILPFEALKNEVGALRSVETFLELEPHDYGDLNVRNASGAAEKSRLLDNLIRGDSPIKRVAKKLLPKGVRSAVKDANAAKLTPTPTELRAAYELLAEDIELASRMVPFDTSHWTRF